MLELTVDKGSSKSGLYHLRLCVKAVCTSASAKAVNPVAVFWLVFHYVGTLDSWIREMFFWGIRNPGLWNPKSHLRLESRIQVLLTGTEIQYLESGIHGVGSRIQGSTSSSVSFLSFFQLLPDDGLLETKPRWEAKF